MSADTMSGATGEGARTLTSERAPDQEARDRAIEGSDRNLLMQAGAGSGKTTTLVARVARILESEDAQLSRVVAITFTEKAAEELRERLRDLCDGRIAGAGDPACQERWRTHRQGVATAHIGTIHGFCSRLLRVHALRLGLDPRFTVLDEAQTSLKLGDTLREHVLSCVRQADEHATALVQSLDLARTVDALVEVVSQRMKPALGNLPTTPEAVLEAWAPVRDAYLRECLGAMWDDSDLRQALVTLREVRPLDPSDKLAQYQQTLLAAYDAVVATGDHADAALPAWLVVGECGMPGNLGSAKKWPDGGLATVKDAARLVIGRVRKLQSAVDVDEAVEASAAELTAHFCAVIPGAIEAYTASKRAESAIDFEDLLLLARDLLRDHPDARAIEQARFEHILVDEFQDTDPVQRELIWYLAERGAHARAQDDVNLTPGKLFLVGDAKQSIYRFRGADVSVYDATLREFSGDDHAEALSLTANFRSQSRLVAFFNEFFANPAAMGDERAARKPFEATYENLAATRPPPEAGSEITFLTGVYEECSTDERRERVAGGLAEHIAETVRNATTTVFDDDAKAWRAPRWGDIMFLVPTMSNVHIYERALRAHGVPYYVVSGKGFFNRPEIIDVVAILRALAEPRDEVALARVLRSPMFGVSDEGLYWLASGGGVATGLQQLAGEMPAETPRRRLPGPDLASAQRASDVLARLRAVRDRLPLPDLLQKILDETLLPAIVATRFDGRRAYANLAKLIEIARQYESMESAPLGRFIEYIQTLRTQEIREGEAPSEEEQGDAVTLMTIHKSKGLQRPIVVVADLARKERAAGRSPLLIHPDAGPVLRGADSDGARGWPAVGRVAKDDDDARDRAERRRLLYVALTRAKDRLIVSTPIPPRRDYRGTHVEILLDVFGEALAASGPLTGAGWSGEVILADDSSSRVAVGGIVSTLLEEHLDRIAEAEPIPGGVGEREHVLQRLPRVKPDLAGKTRFTVTELSAYLACPLHYRLRYVEQFASYSIAAEVATEGKLSASERGTVVHRALQRLGRGPVVNLRRQIEAAMRESGLAGHDPGEVDEIAGIIERFAASDTWRSIERAAELRSEVTVVAKFDSGILEGQVDALFVDDGGQTHLLDYKTGREAEEGKQAEHRFQVGAYAAALQRCGRDLPTSVAVHYLSDDSRVTVDPVEGARDATESVEQAMRGIRTAEFSEPERCDPDCLLAWACERRRA